MTKVVSVFTRGWTGSDSLSGPGSSTKNTERLVRWLPDLLNALPRSNPNGLQVIDLGCGDLHWARMVFSSAWYVGIDAHAWDTWPELLNEGWGLVEGDVTRDIIPNGDVAVCRDVMIHLPNRMNVELISNVRGRARFLLATTYLSGVTRRAFTNDRTSIVKPTKRYAPLDLRLEPFNLGDPVMMIPEYYPGKYLALWDLEE